MGQTEMIRPLNDRVVVSRSKAAEKTEGGIFIPEAARSKQYDGEVVAIGRGQADMGAMFPLDVAVGDRVLFGEYSGKESGSFFFLRQAEIFGTVAPGEGTEVSRYKPLGAKILLEPVEDKYKGLIVIPGNVQKESPIKGRIRAMGPGMLILNGPNAGKRWPMPPCRIGDLVVFYASSGQNVVLDGKKYLSVMDDTVIAVFEEAS